jgi:CelD/BcsL family acetyltransferase involved in cellulose biosynthesis
VPAVANGVAEWGTSQAPQLSTGEWNCECISDSSRLRALADDWRLLWSNVPETTPFQSPDWLIPWWDHYGEGPLISFAFWRERRLVGFAPLYIYKGSVDSCRRVFLLGTGNSDYLDVIFHPEHRIQCWNALLHELEDRAASWDECNLQRLGSHSPMLSIGPQASGLRFDRHADGVCPVVDLRSPAPSSTMLRKNRYYGRKLTRSYSFITEQANAASLDEFLQALEQLHQHRWQVKGQPGVLAQTRDRDFHRCVAHLLLQAQMLRLYGIRVGGRIIAVLYGFRHRQRTYFYLNGFDPQYAQFSVATVLLGYTMERAIGEGSMYFDFLQGQEAYKYRWGALDSQTCTLLIRKAP